jgi:exonuclease SbcD
MTAFKFLHTADIHLDSPLRGLARYEGVPVEQVRMATRDALTKLIDIALEEGVAFVIIAGDLFDGAWDDFSTGLYFCGAMRRLKDAAIPVYIAYGNHDADSLQTKRLPLPENVHGLGRGGRKRSSTRRPAWPCMAKATKHATRAATCRQPIPQR